MELGMWTAILCLESGLPAGDYEDGAVLHLEELMGPCTGGGGEVDLGKEGVV